MNSAQHKTEAERILRKLRKGRKKMHGQMVQPAVAIQMQLAHQVSVGIAQVHATLARMED